MKSNYSLFNDSSSLPHLPCLSVHMLLCACAWVFDPHDRVFVCVVDSPEASPLLIVDQVRTSPDNTAVRQRVAWCSCVTRCSSVTWWWCGQMRCLRFQSTKYDNLCLCSCVEFGNAVFSKDLYDVILLWLLLLCLPPFFFFFYYINKVVMLYDCVNEVCVCVCMPSMLMMHNGTLFILSRPAKLTYRLVPAQVIWE